MASHSRSLGISSRLLVIFGSTFLIAGGILILLVNSHMRQEALRGAEEKAMLILNRNLATHSYINRDMKPDLLEWSSSFRSPDYFQPAWMSSTFAIREIHHYFEELDDGGYYYKECAVNARSPLNEADAYERAFLEELNAGSTVANRTAIRSLDGERFFVVLRRGEIMEKDCLRCHSTPDRAPAGLVAYYGAERSFGRMEGEVVSAISIRVPLEKAYATVNLLSFKLSGVLLALLGGLFALVYGLSRRQFIAPLKTLRDKAIEISGDESHLGEEIPLSPIPEYRDLAISFNDMSARLRRSLDELEDRIRERTLALEEANKELDAFVSTVSHDLRTPLGPILGFAEDLREDYGDSLDEEGLEMVMEIEKAGTLDAGPT